MKKTGIVSVAVITALLILVLVYLQSVQQPASDGSEKVEITEEKKPADKVLEKATANEERKAYASEEEKVVEVPYVGMPESEIEYTLLGEPSDVGSNMEVQGNTHKRVTIYYFYEDGNWIYCARCIDGKVVTVSDYRNEERSSYKPRPKKKDSNAEDDPYNASDYRNAEDFYDDNYYSFFDYYDAEKYYREHTR